MAARKAQERTCDEDEDADTIITLTEEALKILEEVERIKQESGLTTDHIFSYNKLPVNYSYATKCMKRLCKEAGLDEHCMYVFRKTWITTLVDRSGLTLAQIADLAGNSPAVIMRSYYGRRDGLPDAQTISAAIHKTVPTVPTDTE